MKWIDSHIHVDQYKNEERSRLLTTTVGFTNLLMSSILIFSYPFLNSGLI